MQSYSTGSGAAVVISSPKDWQCSRCKEHYWDRQRPGSIEWSDGTKWCADCVEETND